VAIREDEAFWKSTLYPKNRELDSWAVIKEVEDLHDKSIIGNFPCHLGPIFSIEAETGDRWSKKTKLSAGCEYGSHHYLTNEQREEARKTGRANDFTPRYNAYSSFKQIKGSHQYEYNQVKTDKAYKLFKIYVAQFFTRIAELKEGYEKAKAIVVPHSEYLYKLANLKAKNDELNLFLHDQLNPDASPDSYRQEQVRLGGEVIWFRDCDLNSPENIDITTQIHDLISKLKFNKNK
jgi:hypothetical protein